MEIPKHLLDQIRTGNILLFLGAGATVGAVHPEKRDMPQGQKLANLIAEKFLGHEYQNKPLSYVAELAISEASLFKVQTFIAETVRDFEPAPFHRIIPTFVWKVIATTNYDLVLEKAYNACVERSQELSICKKNGESIESRLKSGKNVLYLKLHGCVTEINNEELPLILTVDQYVSHKNGRSRLFDRLTEYSYEYPFLFVGHSLADPDIRAILLTLDQLKSARPRSFMVGPSVTDAEARFWETKKITALKCTFEEFITSINGTINLSLRKLATISTAYDYPILPRFKTTGLKPSESLLSFLSNDVDYLHKSFATTSSNPKAFYKGYFSDWDPIVKQYDVRRGITDSILSEVFLASEDERETLQELYVLKGHAGSGKTVLLRRLAWDAAIDFNKLCLVAKAQVEIDYHPIEELFTLCKERIFLFVEPASDNTEKIISLLSKAKQAGVLLTVISAERHNEWNENCTPLESHLSQDYSLKYLTNKEINELLIKLATFNSLGYLESLTHEKQVEQLSKRAGRELLIALHEATLGKPFSEIILDEYQSIPSLQAQSLYITVSILHRLGVGVRAGLISRVHGISFSTFKEKLFQPLEYIIFAMKYEHTNDYLYTTRHPHIAEMVFEQVLSSSQDRFDEYVRVISCLDVDYHSDLVAFKGLVKARRLMQLFNDPQMIRQLYDHASKRSPNDPLLMQQMAIFEMNSPGGSLANATELLQQAHSRLPWYKPIMHSLSELALKKSEKVSAPIEKEKFRSEAQNLATKLTSQHPETSHSHYTLIKVSMAKLSEALATGDEPSIERLIKDTEKSISASKQIFPNDSTILEVEASFFKLINDEPRAFEALKKAFATNKRSPYIALRLASMYAQTPNGAAAVDVIKEALDLNPGDRDLNFKLAMLLSDHASTNLSEVRHYLRRSFTNGDGRYSAQFWYARCTFLLNEIEEAMIIFKTLRNTNLNIALKRDPIGQVYRTTGELDEFQGVITRLELSYAFLRRDGTADDIFIYRYHQHGCDWADLCVGNRVAFNLAFTYRGPIAMNLRRI
ncbi:MAG TPA: hypothetical protein ENH01_06575 [Nitrospirae bacterium]|nr:hypothetical protein [Nitrospirota bacterium]